MKALLDAEFSDNQNKQQKGSASNKGPTFVHGDMRNGYWVFGKPDNDRVRSPNPKRSENRIGKYGANSLVCNFRGRHDCRIPIF
jgi:hypothetical protein